MQQSINLLLEDNFNRLHLNEESLDKMRHLFGDVIVCICLGSNKSGKSFLMSQLHSQLTNVSHKNFAFKIDHDQIEKTAALNFTINKIELNNSNVNLILIDSEASLFY
jgi:hypothetical protein